MINIPEKIASINTLIQVLSWKKILQFIVFLSIILFSWGVYENRHSVYNYLHQDVLSNNSNGTKVKLSKNTIDVIESYVSKNTKIVGIQVIYVNFQKNSSTVIHTYTDNDNLSILWNKLSNDPIKEFPLFTSDRSNNERLINLINGYFITASYADTLGAKLLPESANYITSIASIGIPPFYGKFTGIVTIYLNNELNEIEESQVRALAKELSGMIYSDFSH